MKVAYGDKRLDNKPQSDVYKTSIYGFVQQLKTFFPDRTLPVVVVPNGISPLRALIQKRKTLKAEDKPFPVFAVSVAETSDKRDTYNYFALHKQGRLMRALPQSGQEDAKIVYTKVHLSPVTQILTVSFLTQDIKDVYDFVPRWLDCSRFRYLSFQIYVENDAAIPPGLTQEICDKFPEAAIDIRVECDSTVNYPDLEIEDIGEFFTVQVSATMSTYNGVITKQLSVSQINLGLLLSGVDQSGKPVQTNLGQISVTPDAPLPIVSS